MPRNVFPDIETHRPWEVTSLKKERRHVLPRPPNKKTRAAIRRHSGSSESIRPYPRSGIKGLLHKTLQHDHVFNVVVGPRFKGNGARTIEDIETSVTLDSPCIGAQLAIRQAGVGHFKVPDGNPDGENIGSGGDQISESFKRICGKRTTPSTILKRLNVPGGRTSCQQRRRPIVVIDRLDAPQKRRINVCLLYTSPSPRD